MGHELYDNIFLQLSLLLFPYQKLLEMLLLPFGNFKTHFQKLGGKYYEATMSALISMFSTSRRLTMKGVNRLGKRRISLELMTLLLAKNMFAPMSPKPDFDVKDKSLGSDRDSISTPIGFQFGFHRSAQNPKLNPNLDDNIQISVRMSN